MKEFIKKIHISLQKIINSLPTINKPPQWHHNFRHMSKNCNIKMINYENNNASQPHHTKIVSLKMKHKKCIINLLNKYKNIKNNYKNIGTRSNNINKKLNKIDNNSKKSAKLSWTDKIESNNYKHKITPVKVDILTTN